MNCQYSKNSFLLQHLKPSHTKPHHWQRICPALALYTIYNYGSTRSREKIIYFYSSTLQLLCYNFLEINQFSPLLQFAVLHHIFFVFVRNELDISYWSSGPRLFKRNGGVSLILLDIKLLFSSCWIVDRCAACNFNLFANEKGQFLLFRICLVRKAIVVTLISNYWWITGNVKCYSWK